MNIGLSVAQQDIIIKKYQPTFFDCCAVICSLSITFLKSYRLGQDEFLRVIDTSPFGKDEYYI